MKKGADIVVADFKLTKSQINKIRRHLPYGFFTGIAERHDGITLRQARAVVEQVTSNPVHNEIVWKAIGKILTKKNETELAAAVKQRLSFCKLLLDI